MDSNGSVKETPKSPIWAANQVLFKTEPPKPPESAAVYYVMTHHSGADNLSQAEIDLLWGKLLENQKKTFIDEYEKIRIDYMDKFEKFVRSLKKDELVAFREVVKKRGQDGDRDTPDTPPAHNENLDFPVRKLSEETVVSKLSELSLSVKETPKSPIWAANQVLFKTEPPKPPETVAAYYVMTSYHSEAGNLSQAEIDLLWGKLSDYQKKKFIDEFDKIRIDYMEKFEKFVRSLETDELKAFLVILKKRNGQDGDSDSDSN